MRGKHQDKKTHYTMQGLKMPANTLAVLRCAAVFVWLRGLSAAADGFS